MLELLLCRAQPFRRQASSLGCQRLTSGGDGVGDVVFDGLVVEVVWLREFGVTAYREVNSLEGWAGGGMEGVGEDDGAITPAIVSWVVQSTNVFRLRSTKRWK